jgi:serine/threonine protein kinase
MPESTPFSEVDTSISRADPEAPTVDDRANLLQNIEPFCDLPDSVVARIAKLMVPRDFAPGEFLVKQGETAGGLIVMVEGLADVTLTDGSQQEHVVNRDIKNVAVGEISLLTGKPNNGSVVATTPVKALHLSSDDFHAIARDVPTLNASFSQLISERLGHKQLDVLFDKVIKGYRIKRRLGRGSMAVVYLAEEESTGQRVALKMMRHPLAYDTKLVARFDHEAKLLASLKHENILPLYDSFAAFNTFFIVMEFCEGGAMSQLIKSHSPLTQAQARPILGQLAKGVAYAHSRGVVHRDLKPMNVLLDDDGTLKLTDFGIARSSLSARLTQEGKVLGTPCYMAPEQLLGNPVDYRADLYAFGCTAYELLTGSDLFEDSDIMGYIQLQLKELPKLSEKLDSMQTAEGVPLDEDFRQLLQTSLQLSPDDRTLDLNRVAEWSAPIDPSLLQHG